VFPKLSSESQKGNKAISGSGQGKILMYTTNQAGQC